MKNEYIQKESNIKNNLKIKIVNILSKIKKDYDNNIIIPLNIYDLNDCLDEIKSEKDENLTNINDLFTIEFLFFLRIAMIYEKSFRIVILRILTKCIEINPLFTNKILDAMIPIVVCKIFEDNKTSLFEEKYICLKFMLTWLQKSDENFPIIFPQSIASLAKTDSQFKIGCLEFLRIMSISRPDICSSVGGFRIIISTIIEEKLPKDMINKILYTIRYIINTPIKRKYYNGFEDMYKLYSLFTKSDFSSGITNNIEIESKKQKEIVNEETKRLEMQLDNAIYIIVTMLKGWAGYFLIFGEEMKIGSLSQSLNNDVNIIAKKAILKLFKILLEFGTKNLDNFTYICSEDNDLFYINKIYIAYVIHALYENHINENLLKFIEDSDNQELREYASRLAIKFSVFFTKLTNDDIQSPFLKRKMEKVRWYESYNAETYSIENGGDIKNISNFLYNYSENGNNRIPIRIKVMSILDKVFHHLNCRDTPMLSPQTLSSEVIIAIHSMLNLEQIKKYENQYSMESCKKVLYSKDEQFTQILKNSKILELKEFQLWDWSQIDALLDIIEIKRDLIYELNKLKFFKKLLFAYLPSKNLIVKQTWNINNFYYGAIGNKLFRILVKTSEGIDIIDTGNEDNIFLKSNSWIKDVIQCMDNLLNSNIIDDHPFTIKRIYNTLSRNIFIFLGIISHSSLGNDYLNKNRFYFILEKFISKNNTFDYLLTLIIDILNFNSKYVNIWIHKLILNGNNQIKKYALNHIRCLLILGKEFIFDSKMLFKALDPEFPDCNKIIISIIKILMNNGTNISNIFKDKSIIKKVSLIDKSLLYLLMRDSDIYNYLIDIINEEVNKMNIEEIVDKYGDEMYISMNEVYENRDEMKNKYYITINLSAINNRYHHYYEYFWIKQLPFNVILTTIENGDKRNEFLLNNYIEYNNDNNIRITSIARYPQQIIFDESISGIQIICLLGRITISRNCNAINNASNFLTFSIKDILKDIIPLNSAKNIFIFKKDGINLIIKQNENKNSFTLEKIFFNIRIRPDILIPFRTPINLITELINNKNGYEKLLEIKAVDKLLSYFENIDEKDVDKNAKLIKSSFWILIKLLLKKCYGKLLQEKYKIVDKISACYYKFKDYSMQGTIIYLTTFSAQNKELRSIIDAFHLSYFFNTSIAYPNEKYILNNDNHFFYENEKLKEDIRIIDLKIKLNSKSEEIYENVTNLINNITFKQSILNLDKIYKINDNYFLDEKLFIKILTVLSKYKLKASARRTILAYFEKCIFSSSTVFNSLLIMNNIRKNLLNSHKLEK